MSVQNYIGRRSKGRYSFLDLEMGPIETIYESNRPRNFLACYLDMISTYLNISHDDSISCLRICYSLMKTEILEIPSPLGTIEKRLSHNLIISPHTFEKDVADKCRSLGIKNASQLIAPTKKLCSFMLDSHVECPLAYRELFRMGLHYRSGGIVIRPAVELLKELEESKIQYTGLDFISPFPYWAIDMPPTFATKFPHPVSRISINDFALMVGIEQGSPKPHMYEGVELALDKQGTLSIGVTYIQPDKEKQGQGYTATLDIGLPLGFSDLPMDDLLLTAQKNMFSKSKEYTEEDHEILRRALRLVVGLSNYISTYRGADTRKTLTRGFSKKTTEQRCFGVQVYEVGEKIASVVRKHRKEESERKEGSTEGSFHGKIRPHWRRRHQRRQPFGPNSQLRKLIWVNSFLVAAGIENEHENREKTYRGR